MATLNGTDLGYVQSEENGPSKNLFVQALPGAASSSAIVLDLMGTRRDINIEAIKVGDTATLQTFITAIEALANATIQTGYPFVSSIHPTTITVFVGSFKHRYSAGDPRTLRYNLSLTEGSA